LKIDNLGFKVLIKFLRPDWDRCANLIDGGVERWRELKMNKSSAQLLEILLDELSASHSGPDTFTGKVRNFKFKIRLFRSESFTTYIYFI
jgi:hypothetical protein